MRILIADDDTTSRLILTNILKKDGHEVVETVNGVEAWHILQQANAPRLAILDWVMPEKDGLEVVRKVRALPSGQHSYLIILTTKVEKTNIVAGLEAGANDYLTKPFDADEIRARVKVGCRVIEMQYALAANVKELRESEEKQRLLLEKTPDPLFSCTPHGCFEYVNNAFGHEIGKPANDIVGKNIADILTLEEAEAYGRTLHHVCGTGKEEVVELHIRTLAGDRWNLTTVSPVKDADGKIISTLWSSKDITERKRLETYGEMGREILQTLNESNGLADALRRVLDILKSRTGFDAVGIRLQEGEDFPYIAHQGFPPDFLLTENTLLKRTATNEICRDEKGDIQLKCICGLVISGRTDLAGSHFTPGGSFWTNDSFSLLELAVDAAPRFQPRNQCIHYQYASIALVPIRNKEHIVGLIHFNDRRKNCFTPESIISLEGIAGYIGAAMIRKQAEHVLQEKRKRLKDVIEFLPDATMAVDSERHVIIWNKAMEEMTGMSATEMIGRGGDSYAILFYGEARPTLIDLVFEEKEEIKALYPNLIRQGDILMAEVFCNAIFRNEGAWVFLKASPLRDQEGNVIGAIESIRNITERKLAEQERKSLQAQLAQAQKMEALGTLAGGIAHDFNNILSGIIGFADLARMKTLDLPVVHEYAKEILAAGTRAAELTRQILTFSRRQNADLQSLHVPLVIKEALKLLRSTLPATVELHSSIDTGVDPVLADPTQIHQVVMNLCVNASHAMEPDGGVLTVTIDQVTPPSDFFTEHPNLRLGDYLRLRVGDTGCGMTPEILASIFVPYFTTKGMGDGTGLGLAVVHGIVKQCCGVIEVGSTPGRGSVFTIYLPVVAEKIAVPEATATVDLAGQDEHILLVDDEPVLCRLYQKVLHQRGYRVTTCSDPLEALALFEQDADTFDLVLADVTMPRMTGDRMGARMMAVRPELPVFLMTGHTRILTEEEARERGFQGLLTKPVPSRELFTRLRESLNRKKNLIVSYDDLQY